MDSVTGKILDFGPDRYRDVKFSYFHIIKLFNYSFPDEGVTGKKWIPAAIIKIKAYDYLRC